ncbi:MAG: methionine--tRNA ligase, partial [Nanoarchaeota archaeon]|nr:methionine--tRNA ligase [Nanoarchaeota archaeon]
VNAKKAGKEPKKFALECSKEHQKDFASYLIKFDNFYHTDSKENKELAEYFFAELQKKKLIYTKKIKVIYCENCKRSLPDRYVKGKCPHCQAEDQYGDICEKCGSVLKGIDLVEPKCSICGQSPVQKESEHYFFKLSSFAGKLQKWFDSKEANLQPEVKNWLMNWLKDLDDWCVSRDSPYFGFEIPGSKKETGETKYFYVWLDAPIGYISSTKNYCDTAKCKWEDYWYKGSVQHFIGKDIAYFHYLFWPAMLMAVGIPLPQLTTHGWVTVNGEKMSKSRGTFFTAKDFLKLYQPEALRFYYAQHLDRKVVDVDLNFTDFQAVVNNVLMGNLGNFCYRTLTFAEKNYGQVKEVKDEKVLVKKVEGLFEKIKQNYQEQNFKLAVKYILQIADLGNIYFQKAEPWKDKEKKSGEVGFCVNLARNLAILVSPILPQFSEKIFSALGERKVGWADLNFKWQGKVKKVVKLVEKIEKIPEKSETVEQETFPLQMKVGKIIEVKDHPDADSLYLLKVNFGKEKRQVVAGLKKKFSVKELLNRQTVFCTNLKKAKLRGEWSEAMILVAEKGKDLYFLDPGKVAVGSSVGFGKLVNSKKEVSYSDFQKLKMVVQKEKVVCNGKELNIAGKVVTVPGAKDGAKIC